MQLAFVRKLHLNGATKIWTNLPVNDFHWHEMGGLYWINGKVCFYESWFVLSGYKKNPFSQQNLLHIYKSIIHSFNVYCCYIWSSVSDMCLVIMERIQIRNCTVMSPDLETQIPCIFTINTFMVIFYETYTLDPPPHDVQLSIRLETAYHHFIAHISGCNCRHHTNRSFLHLCKSFQTPYLAVNCNNQKFKSNVSRSLLFLWMLKLCLLP